MKTDTARKLNPAIMSNADAADYLGCSLPAVKAMKSCGRLVGVTFGRKGAKANTRYVTRESVERVLRGEV